MEISTHLSFYTQLSVNNLSITLFLCENKLPIRLGTLYGSKCCKSNWWTHFTYLLLQCVVPPVCHEAFIINLNTLLGSKNRKKEVLLYRSLYVNTNMDHYTKLTEFYRDFNPAKLLEEEIKHSTLWNSSSQPHKQNTINTLYHFH